MNVNIYYGGRGLIEDPTLYVLEKIENVLEELHVNVTRYNLFEIKNSITTLPQSMKEADAVIMAASVEWMGIGGLMTEFLDACWLYADKTKISSMYMMPVVVATTYGEREAMLTLKNAWGLLGGIICDGVETYIEDSFEFKNKKEFTSVVEKKVEDLYRSVSKKVKSLPSSTSALKQSMIKESLNLTPQESEQLSRYVSDDVYVKKQKEDIEELASMFKGLLSERVAGEDDELVESLNKSFVNQENFSASYSFMLEDRKKDIYIEVNNDKIICRYEKKEDVDVIVKLTNEVMNNIIKGRITFQRAFMTGEMKAKGNFKTLRMLDELFNFS